MGFALSEEELLRRSLCGEACLHLPPSPDYRPNSMNIRRKQVQLKKEERKLRVRPTASGYLDLASSYAEIGLNEDANRAMDIASRMIGPRSTESQIIRQKYYMSGQLNRDILTELIQMFSRLQSSGQLVLEMKSGTAHVYFQRGQVINVRLGHGVEEGLEGMKEVLKNCDGTYHFIQREIIDVKTSVFVNCQALLLEAIKAVDERRAG